MRTPRHASALLLALFLAMPLTAFAQHLTGRRIERGNIAEGPLELVGLEIGGQPTHINGPVIADRDWLKSLRLDFKNNHDRTIVYMSVEFEIARAGKMEYPQRLGIRFGKRPGDANDTRDPKTVERLAPGKTKRLAFSDESWDFLVKFMKENEVDDIEKVEMFVNLIIFDDGTAWGKGGHLMRQDPKNPESWMVVGMWADRSTSSLRRMDGGPPGDPPTQPPRSQSPPQNVSPTVETRAGRPASVTDCRAVRVTAAEIFDLQSGRGRQRRTRARSGVAASSCA